MAQVNAVGVEQQDRAQQTVALIFDEVNDEGQDLSERRAGCDHLEHLVLPGPERFFLPRRGYVAGDRQQLLDVTAGVPDWRDDHVPPLRCGGLLF